MTNALNQGQKEEPIEERKVIHQSDIPPQTIYSRHLKLDQLPLLERSSDPDDPPEGQSVIWMSDGTGSGDDGDLMIKITAGGTTSTGTITDFSGL